MVGRIVDGDMEMVFFSDSKTSLYSVLPFISVISHAQMKKTSTLTNVKKFKQH